MQVKQVFYSPKDVAIIFDMSVPQVLRYARKKAAGFPRGKQIGDKRKQWRFNIEETMQCAVHWKEDEEDCE